ncbi:MAG TPA: TerC family protein, partial [Opitutaceae bacterium]
MVLWTVFIITIVGMLVLDLGVLNRKAHTISLKEALAWSAAWVVLALLFAIGIYLRRGSEPALEFLTGYAVEKALSVDNIFVFMLIFTYFHVDPRYQHKVLFLGILGALAMRALFIAAGVVLIREFHGILYAFGVLLILAGARMFFGKDEKIRPEKNPVLRLFRRFVPVTKDYEGSRFFVRKSGVLHATPLFIVLLVVETTDVVFAVDSIPAIFAITLDPFIVYTSNVFAMLGLRALYFALGGVMKKFEYLHSGLAAILMFVGVKMLIADLYRIRAAAALGVVAAVLLITVIASIIRREVAK